MGFAQLNDHYHSDTQTPRDQLSPRRHYPHWGCVGSLSPASHSYCCSSSAMRRGKKRRCLKCEVSRAASVSTVLPRADPGKERAISGISQSLQETGGRSGGKSWGRHTATVHWGLEIGLYGLGGRLGRERDGMGEKSSGKEPSPSWRLTRPAQPLRKEPLGREPVGRRRSWQGPAWGLRPLHAAGCRQRPAASQKLKKRVCIPSSKAQLWLQIQMYGQNVNALWQAVRRIKTRNKERMFLLEKCPLSCRQNEACGIQMLRFLHTFMKY